VQSQPNSNRDDKTTRANGVAFECRGQGEPLLLIHGTGGSRFHWQPILQQLSQHRRVVLVDLPGHGESSPVPPNVRRNPTGYAALLARMLDELGVETVDVCGHSAGGWTALELAKLGRAQSVVAIAPAGLWAKRDPWSHLTALLAQYAAGRAFAPATPAMMRSPKMRSLLLQRSFARPQTVPPYAAIEIAQTLAKTRGLPAHLRSSRTERFRDGRHLNVPVTVAWGNRDRLVPASSQRREELPATTRFVTLENCGHMAMWDDPDAVGDLILRGTLPQGAHIESADVLTESVVPIPDMRATTPNLTAARDCR
jgi:pimeloyl-ACP methyl ester carboxylesterase